MTDAIMSQAPDIEWWRKLTAKVELGWQLGPNAIYPARKWLFDSEGAFVRQYRGFRVFWLRGWVRILGLEAGAAVFWRGPAIAAAAREGENSRSEVEGEAPQSGGASRIAQTGAGHD